MSRNLPQACSNAAFTLPTGANMPLCTHPLGAAGGYGGLLQIAGSVGHCTLWGGQWSWVWQFFKSTSWFGTPRKNMDPVLRLGLQFGVG
eukprot:149936-Pelagomonas_calceolata.AAC.12